MSAKSIFNLLATLLSGASARDPPETVRALHDWHMRLTFVRLTRPMELASVGLVFSQNDDIPLTEKLSTSRDMFLKPRISTAQILEELQLNKATAKNGWGDFGQGIVQEISTRLLGCGRVKV